MGGFDAPHWVRREYSELLAATCGVAFAHLRRPGPPCLQVRRDRRDFVYNGTAPWFTGWGLMQLAAVGGTAEDGSFIHCLVSLDLPGLTASKPMRLCARNASGTVALRFEEVRVPKDCLLMMSNRVDGPTAWTIRPSTSTERLCSTRLPSRPPPSEEC